MVICVEEMLKRKRVCHTFEVFYFCQSGIFFFAAYSTEKIFSTVRLPSIESRLISVMTPTVGLHGFCRCSVTA